MCLWGGGFPQGISCVSCVHWQGMKCACKCVQTLRVVLINAFSYRTGVFPQDSSANREKVQTDTHLELGWGFYVQLKLYLYVNMTVIGA